MPLLTLTSDFGTSDPIVGALKGEILKLNEGFQLVDITHEIDPYNFMQAAYISKSIFTHYPEESFHLILFNLFDANLDHVLLVKHRNQFIGLPDNGLITMILEGTPEQVVRLPFNKKGTFRLQHFIEIWMQAFSSISSGAQIDKIGEPAVELVQKNLLKAYISSQYIESQILMIDRFNNVVVNITKDEFEQARNYRKFKIVLLRDAFIEEIHDTYFDVPEGEKLARFNESGYLEIAVNKGFAASLFGLGEFGVSAGQQKRQYYQTIKIFFE
jgi:S-adenosyl-L-methionine hydrolase (adenosine-forming)